MINLLPPQIREQMTFARRNAIVVGYFKLAVVMVILLGGMFVAAYWYVNEQAKAQDAALTTRQQQMGAYADVENKVKQANDRLTAIAKFESNQSKFSDVLADLAAHLPQGAYLNNISLNGDDTKPLIIDATTDTFQTAALCRNALATSSRINAVDLQSITANQDGTYHVRLAVAYKRGEAK